MHIENFVREVNRGRVIHVEAAMRPLAPGREAASRDAVTVGTTLDDAMKRLVASGAAELAITDANGQTVGTLSPSDIVGAMVGGG